MNDKLTINELNRQNPWWLSPSLLAEDPNKPTRDIYPVLKNKIIGSELITAITGLRRIGKTTIMKQVINSLLRNNVKKSTILFFSFEEFTLSRSPDLLSEMIEYQLKRNPNTKLYFFLDEIQYVDKWNSVLKKYLDLLPGLKFIVSGSSSLFIKTGAKETLAGRMLEIVMRPFTFQEYLRISCGLKKDLDPAYLNLQEKFFEYLSFGEFPYLAKLESFTDKKQYVLDWVIGKVLESDLPKLQPIRKLEKLIALGNILIAGSGLLIELQNLAQDLGMARDTLSDYLQLLKKTHLIGEIFNKNLGFRTRSLRQRKIYATSTNALVLKNTSGPSSESFSSFIGQIVETYVYNYLLRKEKDLFFWRQRQAKEVDFISIQPDGIIPIEVKYQKQVRPSDLKNLIYYCQKEKIKKALVVTKEKKGMEKLQEINLEFIPAHLLY